MVGFVGRHIVAKLPRLMQAKMKNLIAQVSGAVARRGAEARARSDREVQKTVTRRRWSASNATSRSASPI
jgi:hypothetical protein